MNRIFRLLYIITLIFILSSCTEDKNKEEVLQVYSEIFPEFIHDNPIIRSYFEKLPPVSEYDYKDSLSANDKLKEKIRHLEWRLDQLEKRQNNQIEYDILNKLLPINPENFKKTECSAFSTKYDTLFINPKRVEVYEIIKENRFFQEDIKNFKQNIVLVNQIPDYDSTLDFSQQEPFINFCYIQLSWIVFNKEKNRGMFYYGITNKERISSNFSYEYIIKENNRWRLKK